MSTRASRRAGARSSHLTLGPRRLVGGWRSGHALIRRMRWESETRYGCRGAICTERAGLLGQRGHVQPSDKFFPAGIQERGLVDIHEDPALLEHAGAVLLEKEIKGLSERTRTCWAEQLGSDCVGISIAAPDYAKILEHVRINVRSRRDRTGELGDGRCRNINNTRSVLSKPRMNKNIWDL